MTGPLLSRNHAKVAVGRPDRPPSLSSDAPALSVGQMGKPRTSGCDATRVPDAPQLFLEKIHLEPPAKAGWWMHSELPNQPCPPWSALPATTAYDYATSPMRSDHRAKRLRHRHRPHRSRVRRQGEGWPPQPLPDPTPPPTTAIHRPRADNRRTARSAHGLRCNQAVDTAAEKDLSAHPIRPTADASLRQATLPQ